MIQFSSGANQLFSKLDTDRNGISVKELKDLVQKADGTGVGGKADGQLTAEEINAALQEQGIQVELKPEDIQSINAALTQIKEANFEPNMVMFQRMGGSQDPAAVPDELMDYIDSGLLTTAETGAVSESQIQDLVREVQRRLSAMGYERAQESGVMDDVTRTLIKDLQQDHGMAANGRWNPALSSAAERIANLPPSDNLAAAAAEEVPRVAEELGQTSAGRRLASAASDVAGDMRSTGYCYRGVKQAIRRATGTYLEGGSAWMAGDQLARTGKFTEAQAPRQPALSQYLRNLPPGAVVVWPQTNRSPHGHISVALGGGREASDHVSNQNVNLRGENTVPRVFLPQG